MIGQTGPTHALSACKCPATLLFSSASKVAKMGSRRNAPNLRNYSVTREQWDKMLAAYRQHPTIKTVMTAGGVGKRIARRAVMEGWPDLGLPPFVELMSSGTSVHKEMAVLRESWEEAAVTQGEAARMAAEQAMAARTVMASAMKSSRVIGKMMSELHEKIDNKESLLPEEVTPKVINQVMSAQAKLAETIERAMKIANMRAGEPEKQLGVQIGILLERCNDDELEVVIQCGELPGRVLDQRRRVLDVVAADASERRALAAGGNGAETPAQEPQEAPGALEVDPGYPEDPDASLEPEDLLEDAGPAQDEEPDLSVGLG